MGRPARRRRPKEAKDRRDPEPEPSICIQALQEGHPADGAVNTIPDDDFDLDEEFDDFEDDEAVGASCRVLCRCVVRTGRWPALVKTCSHVNNSERTS